MKNFRTGAHDVSPPTRLYGQPPATSALRIGCFAMVIFPGPSVAFHVAFEPDMSLRKFMEFATHAISQPPPGTVMQ